MRKINGIAIWLHLDGADADLLLKYVSRREHRHIFKTLVELGFIIPDYTPVLSTELDALLKILEDEADMTRYIEEDLEQWNDTVIKRQGLRAKRKYLHEIIGIVKFLYSSTSLYSNATKLYYQAYYNED